MTFKFEPFYVNFVHVLEHSQTIVYVYIYIYVYIKTYYISWLYDYIPGRLAPLANYIHTQNLSVSWTPLGQIEFSGGVLISGVVKYTDVAFETDESVLFMEVSSIRRWGSGGFYWD